MSDGRFILIATRLEDLYLLDQFASAPANSILLALRPDERRQIAELLKDDPRIAQFLAMDEPTGPRRHDGLLVKKLVSENRISDVYFLINSPLTPLRFNPNFLQPNPANSYDLYRFLRLNGCKKIIAMGPNWQEAVQNYPMLEEFIDCHKGQRAFVAGNGPSLNAIDMTALKDEITFGSNRCFLGFEEWGYEFTYWGIEDRLQIEKYYDEYADGLNDNIVKFVPFDYVFYSQMPNTCFFPLQYGNGTVYPDNLNFPIFSNHPRQLYHGFTITYSLIQLAALMGIREIYLIGIDHTYGLGARVVKSSRDATWNAADAGVATHFNASYTSGKKEFVKPRPVNAETSYACARQWCAYNGVTIKNATPGTHLDVFETTEFESLF